MDSKRHTWRSMDSNRHREYIAAEAARLCNMKYAAGQDEHGGHLWRKPLLPHMLAEQVDAMIYLLTFRDQLSDVVLLLKHGIQQKNWALVEDAALILTHGNAQGWEEEERNPDQLTLWEVE